MMQSRWDRVRSGRTCCCCESQEGRTSGVHPDLLILLFLDPWAQGTGQPLSLRSFTVQEGRYIVKLGFMGKVVSN